jgi:hypothetical protein
MDQPLRFGSWRFTRSAHTRSGKRLLRRPLDQAQALAPIHERDIPRALRSGSGALLSSLSPNNAGLPMFLPRRLDFPLALAKGYSLLGSQILESCSR